MNYYKLLYFNVVTTVQFLFLERQSERTMFYEVDCTCDSTGDDDDGSRGHLCRHVGYVLIDYPYDDRRHRCDCPSDYCFLDILIDTVTHLLPRFLVVRGIQIHLIQDQG